MYRTHATQAEVHAYRDETRRKYAGQPFTIEANGYGLRVECTVCHTSATLNPEAFMAGHPDRHADEYIADYFDTELERFLEGQA